MLRVRMPVAASERCLDYEKGSAMKKRQESSREQILKVELIDGRIVISIGVETLRVAASASPALEWPYPEGEIEIHDPDAFAKDVVGALEWETGDDGTTCVHEMFDRAFERVVEDGSESVVLPEEN